MAELQQKLTDKQKDECTHERVTILREERLTHRDHESILLHCQCIRCGKFIGRDQPGSHRSYREEHTA